jgi:desulfoferrodoxin (superoxide reductase-like protein)
MAIIAMFYGIIVSMYFFDRRRHHIPHIHVKYQAQEAVVSVPAGELLEGELKPNKMKLVQAWIEIHQDELMADWELATKGEAVFKIEPLK